ncbi:helix-turn-helix domain-containing protein, partial [Salmonella enterica]|uniref:helix-turn-helix domain-containing protein n=1 Tax=Salmonella enterica TaxID=28901 RepID=UPI0020C2830E
MRIEDIEGLLRVAELGHVGDAAAELGIPQPTLSRRLARVEAEFGSPLFDRAGRGVMLNSRGRAALAHLTSATHSIDQAKLEVRRLMDP